MSSFIVIIPARMASTRLPDKPLADLGGKPMVVRVAERAHAAGAAQVIVATDHPAIVAACEAHGIAVRMTRADHPSGTDRIAEVAAAIADHSLTAAAVGRALDARGHRMAEQSITRHRRGACRCDHE